MAEIRYDAGRELPPVRRDSNGWIRVDGGFTRAGIFVYKNPDGTDRRELRPLSEVTDPESLETFNAIPVTDDHPPDLLNADNTSEYARGSVLNVRADGQELLGSLRVTDKKLIAKMEKGKRAVSVGYTVEYDETPGTDPTFGRYDGIQRKIRANHIAIVSSGRAGADARVRMDHVTEIVEPNPVASIDKNVITGSLSNCKDNSLMALSITESEHVLAATKAVEEVSKRADKAEADLKVTVADLTAEKARADAAEGKADELAANVKTLQERLDALSDHEKIVEDNKALKVRIDELDEELKTAADPKKFNDAVRVRAGLERAAVAILGDKARIDGDDAAIMVAVIERVSGPVKAEASPEYLRARFDAAVEAHANSAKSLNVIREVARKDAENGTPRNARQEMINRYRNREGK